ncbi:MAG: NUDIX hydrolase [Corynebacterium sp.]|nr:NUDIX hydrolase [Corynebacterium sp.]
MTSVPTTPDKPQDDNRRRPRRRTQKKQGGNQQGGGQQNAQGNAQQNPRSNNTNKPNTSKPNGQNKPNNRAGNNKAGGQNKPGGSKPNGNKPGNQNRNSGGNKPRNQKRNNNRPNRGRPNRKNGPKRRGGHMPVSNETSAGGLVISGLAEAVDAQGEVNLDRIYAALIGRLDRRGRLLWSMPKGHVEPGEKYARTAEREVWEETGVHGTVFTRIGSIDYWFVSEGVRIHKSVYHYLLRYTDGVFNDEDPEVTEVAWFPVTKLASKLAYADERKLARTALEKLPQFAKQEKAAGRVTPR